MTESPLRDDKQLYSKELVEAVVPTLSHPNIVNLIGLREPELASLSWTLSETLVQRAFGTMDGELEQKAINYFHSAILTGVLLTETLRKKIEVDDLNEIMSRKTKEGEE